MRRLHPAARSLLVSLLCMAALSSSQVASAAASASYPLPPAGAAFDYQLGGAYTPPAGVTVVVRDRTDTPVTGAYSICYINAFQTQDSDAAFWKKHTGLLLHDSSGHLVEDANWPGEYILDTRTAAKRSAIARIEYAWIDGCARAGYQAIDPDNLDSWSRSGGRITPRMNLALAQLLAARAHRDGLAIGQKNASELGTAGRRIGFDFAVAESCQVYDECDAYTAVFGRHVLEIEYTTDARSYFTASCRVRGSKISIIRRDLDLVAKGRPGYHYESC